MGSITRPHRGDPAASPCPAQPVWGELCFARGVQAEGRGGEGCQGVPRPPLPCEECCESRGKHPQAASPSPCLPTGSCRTATRGCESRTRGFGVSQGRAVPWDTPVPSPRADAEPTSSRAAGAVEVAVTPAPGHGPGGQTRLHPQPWGGQT